MVCAPFDRRALWSSSSADKGSGSRSQRVGGHLWPVQRDRLCQSWTEEYAPAGAPGQGGRCLFSVLPVWSPLQGTCLWHLGPELVNTELSALVPTQKAALQPPPLQGSAGMLPLPGSPCWFLQMFRVSTNCVPDVALDQTVLMSDSTFVFWTTGNSFTGSFFDSLIHHAFNQGLRCPRHCARPGKYNSGKRRHGLCTNGIKIHQRRATNNRPSSTQTHLQPSRIPACVPSQSLPSLLANRSVGGLVFLPCSPNRSYTSGSASTATDGMGLGARYLKSKPNSIVSLR